MRFLSEENLSCNIQPSDLKQLKEAVKLVKGQPKTFDDCVAYAITKFYKYFRNDIIQLLHTYPLDIKTKDGEPFWKLPKRPPQPIMQFDPKDIRHARVVTAIAVLKAKNYGIEYPKSFREDKVRFEIAEQAAKIKVPDFVPDTKKAQEIMKQVEQAEKPKEEQDKLAETQMESEQKEQLQSQEQEMATLAKDMQDYKSKLDPALLAQGSQKKFMTAEEFEKDQDSNGHIDYIEALGNMRAISYKLEPMDWIEVKLKAGRIIPALATTTAVVAGLQTIELIKIMKGEKVDNMKNAFLNLAIPQLVLGEPGSVPKIKIHENLTTTIWDRWDVKLGADVTVKQLFEHLQKTYKLLPQDGFQSSKCFFSSILLNQKGKEKDKEKVLSQKLTEVLDIEKDDEYVDLTITFTLEEDGELLKGIPLVRVFLK